MIRMIERQKIKSVKECSNSVGLKKPMNTHIGMSLETSPIAKMDKLGQEGRASQDANRVTSLNSLKDSVSVQSTLDVNAIAQGLWLLVPALKLWQSVQATTEQTHAN